MVAQAAAVKFPSSDPRATAPLVTLGQGSRRRAADILAGFNRPSISNRAIETIIGRLEWLRGSAQGFENLTNQIADGLAQAESARQPVDRQARPKTPQATRLVSWECARSAWRTRRSVDSVRREDREAWRSPLPPWSTRRYASSAWSGMLRPWPS